MAGSDQNYKDYFERDGKEFVAAFNPIMNPFRWLELNLLNKAEKQTENPEKCNIDNFFRKTYIAPNILDHFKGIQVESYQPRTIQTGSDEKVDQKPQNKQPNQPIKDGPNIKTHARSNEPADKKPQNKHSAEDETNTNCYYYIGKSFKGEDGRVRINQHMMEKANKFIEKFGNNAKVDLEFLHLTKPGDKGITENVCKLSVNIAKQIKPKVVPLADEKLAMVEKISPGQKYDC